MTKQHPILIEIDAYLHSTGMSETYFGKKAAGNSELVARLRDGGGLHFCTEEKVRRFIRAETAPATYRLGSAGEGGL